MEQALQRILELEEEGIALSRNRHFEFYKEQKNRAALEAWRRVGSLRRALHHHHGLGTLELDLQRLDAPHMYRLIARIEEVAARLEWRVHAGEIGILLRDPVVRGWFGDNGLELPAAGEAFMARETTP